ncbi:MAG TPA: DinB family protein, partial [Thermomicrobiaceae bacterium]|nr:DinB family protein [Thermomicrobiaceae bacterium]
DNLSNTPAQLQSLLDGYQAPAESGDDWGPREIVAHLVDIEVLYRGRINDVLGHPGAYLKVIDENKLARDHDYGSSDLQQSLGTFAEERGETISLLMNLALRDWDKTGIHEERGEVSVEELAESLVNHDAEHLETIRALTSAG